jgi:uncharacterized protein (DUF1697 family)
MATKKSEKTGDAYVALLRGINLGGRRLPMPRLAEMFVEAGCRDVRTYIQSGNVVFGANATLAKRIPGLVAGAIEGEFGFDCPVVVRSATEMRSVARENPFLKKGADPAALHVMFLADEPDKVKVATLDPKRSPPDTFVVRGRDIYLHLLNGAAKTKLTNQYFDSRLKTVSTIRNWNTVLKLTGMSLPQ